MPHLTAADWDRVLHTVDCAFQPIVNIHTGALYGVEALIRNVDEAGFESIPFFRSVTPGHSDKPGARAALHHGLQQASAHSVGRSGQPIIKTFAPRIFLVLSSISARLASASGNT